MDSSNKLSKPHYVSRFTFYPPALISFLLVAALYLAALVAMPPQGLTEHDTGAKYLQVRNLRLAPTGLDWSINYPARSLDPDLRFVPFRTRQYFIQDQRIYLQWPIFLGLLTRVPWKVMGFWGLYVVPLLAGLGCLWAAYGLALAVGLPRRVAWLALPLLGLATPIAIYSLLFFEHTLAALLVALSLLAGVRAVTASSTSGTDEGKTATRLTKWLAAIWRRPILLSAGFLALAIYFRSELYILALVMALVYAYMAWRDRAWRPRLMQWLGAFVVMLVPLWLFYALSEGTLLPLHAIWYFTGSDNAGGNVPSGGFELPAIRYLASAGWGVVPDFLFGPQTFPSSPRFPEWVEWLGMLGLLLCAVPALLRLLRRRVEGAWQPALVGVGLALVLLPSLAALLQGEQYYNLHGFLLASPFVALALWPAGESASTPQGWLQTVVLAHVGLHALVISALSGLGPISRHEWGQRYLLPAYPGLVVLALLGAYRLWTTRNSQLATRNSSTVHRPPSIVLPVLTWSALCLIGCLLDLRGYAATYAERQQVVEWQALARTLPDREPLVTDTWWLPLNLAPDFYTRPIMLAEGDAKLSEWVKQMQSRGVTAFGLMTSDPAVFSGAWLQSSPTVLAETPQPQQANGIWLQRYTLGGSK